jgi:magnesium-transporting ATPase (P-type)
MSPKQKAEVVHIIKSINPEKSTLSIGDGANDVGMILEAGIGVGIQGIEGTEACSASDYVLTQFHHLQKLLLFHGRESYRRNSYYIIYEFYKNVVFTSPFIYFGFISFFSGESFYDAMLIQLFDMLYSDFPMFYFAIFDKEYETEEYTKRPELYIQGICNKCFNNKIFWKNMILGYIEGLIITLFCCFLYEYNIEGYTDNDIISIGEIVFSGVVIAINVKVLLRVCVIDFIIVALDIAGVALFYFTIFVFSTSDYEYILKPILFIFKEINVYDTNEYLITKKKYLVYFMSIVFFVCFLDIFANRINFKYLKGLFNKDKSFILFDKNKYLIEVNNNSLNSDDKDEYEKDNIIFDEDYELLKKNVSNNKIKNSDFELES